MTITQAALLLLLLFALFIGLLWIAGRLCRRRSRRRPLIQCALCGSHYRPPERSAPPAILPCPACGRPNELLARPPRLP